MLQRTLLRKHTLIWISITFLMTLALAVRFPLMKYTNADTATFLMPWFNYIVTHGGFHAMADPFSNYTPVYTYLLALATLLPIPEIYAIKVIPIAFDFIAAGVTFAIVSLYTSNQRIRWGAFFAVVFVPVVIFDGAFWGQADMIYTAFLLAFLFFMLHEHPLAAMLCFSLAFSIKLQAVFIGPLVLALILRRKIPWTYLSLPALIYFVIALPAWIAGRPLFDLITIYLKQGGFYKFLSLNAPNPYLLIPNDLYPIIVPVGLGIGALVGLVLTIALWRSYVPLTGGLLLQAATLIVLIMPFVLPKMHERYFFPAAILAIPLAFYRPKFKVIPLILEISLLLSFLPFFKGYPIIVLELAMLINLFTMIWLSIATFYELYPANNKTIIDASTFG